KKSRRKIVLRLLFLYGGKNGYLPPRLPVRGAVALRRPARRDRALPARLGMPCASAPPGRAAGARAGLRAGVPASSSLPRALRGVLRSFSVLPAASSFFGVWGSLGSRRLRSTGSAAFCSQRRFCEPCRYKISVLPT